MEGKRANQWRKPTLPSENQDVNPNSVTKPLSNFSTPKDKAFLTCLL